MVLRGHKKGIFMKVTKSTSLGIGALLLLVGIGFYILIPSYFFVVNHCTFKFDGNFAETMKNTIMKFSQEKFLKRSFFSVAPEVLKQEFPLIKAVQCDYQYGGKVCCFLQAIEPLLIINNSFCLLRNGDLRDMHYFSDIGLQDLPSISIQSNEKLELLENFKECIQRMPLYFFDHFTITWRDHTFIQLQDKKFSQCTIIAHYQTAFDDLLLRNYEVIKQEIMSQHLNIKKQWIVDIRFKNQIVVAQKNVGEQ